MSIRQAMTGHMAPVRGTAPSNPAPTGATDQRGDRSAPRLNSAETEQRRAAVSSLPALGEAYAYQWRSDGLHVAARAGAAADRVPGRAGVVGPGVPGTAERVHRAAHLRR